MQSLHFKPVSTRLELVQVSVKSFATCLHGYWWEDPMHTFQDGMISLHRAFMQQGSAGLYKEVRFGATAWKVEYRGNEVLMHYTTDASLGTLRVATSLAQCNVIRGDVASYYYFAAQHHPPVDLPASAELVHLWEHCRCVLLPF